MAIIYSYPAIDEVQGSDLILIADASKRNQTKSASVSQLLADVLDGSDFTGDIVFTNNSNGVVLKSPNGTQYRITVDNEGNLNTTSV